ncbi:hypothetical protein ACFX2I_032810 [Malus domestica]
MESELGLIEQSFISCYLLWVQEALGELPDSFTITDPWISGHPIVFASKEFLKMSGYSKNEVVGRNNRVFQGPRTCRRSFMEVRKAIREERAVLVNLLNSRKGGTPFLMMFHLCHKFAHATLKGPSVVKEILYGSVLVLACGSLWKMHHWNEQRKVRAFYDLLEKGEISVVVEE